MIPKDTEEKLRKLAPIDAKKADLSWLFFLSGEGEERQQDDLRSLARQGTRQHRRTQRGDQAVCHQMVPAAVCLQSSECAQTVQVGHQARPCDERAVPPLAQAEAREPGEHEVSLRMHDPAPVTVDLGGKSPAFWGNRRSGGAA